VKKRECNLNEIIDDAVNAVSPQAAEKGLPLNVQCDARDKLITTDPERVRQILVNLLSNAVKFTKEGSVDLHVNLTDDSIDLLVRDTGPGIPLEYQERVFVEFEQVPGSIGTGLGLPIARNLAELLGGSLSLESKVGIGSTFALTLPVS
jgi:signal transduction histidine kinase